MEYLATFAVGFLASVLGGIAGGGSALVTAPFFIMMGLPPASAVATAKFGAVGISLGGLLRFRKTSYVRKDYLMIFIIIAAIGGIIGPTILLSTDEGIIEKAIAFMMLGSLPFLFTRKDTGLIQRSTQAWQRNLGYFLYFCVAILGSAFGGGIGMLVPIIMISMFGFTTLEASATRKVPGGIEALLALTVYLSSGVVNYGHGISMLVGTIIGAWIGAHIAVKKGEKFVKWFFLGVVVLMAFKLLVG